MAKEEKVDNRRLGLFKEVMSVIFDIHPKQLDRVLSVLSNSEDIVNIKTHIVRNHAGARALKYMRLAVEYARHEGSQKHESGDDEFELSKEQDIESSARNERPQEINPTPEEGIDMDNPIKECTFKDYLITELMVSDDPGQALQDVKTAARSPERYQKQKLKDTVNQQREIQKSKDDPNKADKLRLAQLQKEMQMKQKRLADKEKRAEQELGIEGDTGERPGTGLM